MPDPDETASGALPAELEERLAEIHADAALDSQTRLEVLCAEYPAHAARIRQLVSSLRLCERDVGAGDDDRCIGPYRILGELGEGGMGTVFLAEQREPVRRRVALKVIKRGMDSKQVLARFEAERQALALMEHSNIAKVFDGGVTADGRPYFVMEYVKGEPITDYCDRMRLDIAARLALFRRVCDGVQHAHQKGVIHRDLKPGNVLVAYDEDEPMPKIIDFGLARATDHRLATATLFTEYGQFIGTPEYMSPEQANPGPLDVDTRTDVYALGVVLYELLVGELPFSRGELRQAGLAEIQRIIRELDPPRPSTRLGAESAQTAAVTSRRRIDRGGLVRALRRDLDWIVMKALEKDPARRYQTASAFAADVAHVLADEPVEARPPSVVYRVRKLAARHRAAFAVGTMAALLVVGGPLVFAVNEASARERISREKRAADAARSAADAAREQERAARETAEAERKLAVSAREEAERQRDLADGRRLIAQATLAVEEDPSLALLLALEAARRVPGVEANEVLLQSLRAKRELRRIIDKTPDRGSPIVSRLEVSADGRWVARLFPARICVDSGTGEHAFDLYRESATGLARISNLAFAPSGRYLALLEGRVLSIWDLDDGARVRRVPLDVDYDHEDAWQIRFGESGQELLVAASGELQVVDAAAGDVRERRSLSVDAVRLYGQSATADGRFALGRASALGMSWAALVDTRTGRSRALMPRPLTEVAIGLGPDGRCFAYVEPANRMSLAPTGPGTLRVVWLDGGEDREARRSAPNAVSIPWEAPRFTPDGARVIAQLPDGQLGVWSVEGGADPVVLLAGTAYGPAVRDLYGDSHGERRVLDISADGALALTEVDEALCLHALADGGRLARWNGAVEAARFLGSSRRFAVWFGGDGLRILDDRAWTERSTLSADLDQVWPASFSPDGSRLATRRGDRLVEIDVASRVERVVTDALPIPDLEARRAAGGWQMFEPWFCAGGSRLLIPGELDGRSVLCAYDAATGARTGVFPGGLSLMEALRPDGRQLLSLDGGELRVLAGGSDDSVAVVPLRSESGATEPVTSAFSADSRRCAIIVGETVSVWDTQTWRPLLRGDARSARRAHLSRDGAVLAVDNWEPSTAVWAVDPTADGDGLRAPDIVVDGGFCGFGGERALIRCLPAESRRRSSSRGRSAVQDATVEVWDVPNRRRIASLDHPVDVSPRWPLEAGHGGMLSPDGAFALTTGCDLETGMDELRLWDVMTGTLLDRRQADRRGFRGIATSSPSNDGSIVLAFGPRRAYLVDLARGAIRYAIPVEPASGGIRSAAFTPDGHRILVRFGNGVGRLYPADPVGAARAEASRRLTIAERRRFDLWGEREQGLLDRVTRLRDELLYVGAVRERIEESEPDEASRADMLQLAGELGDAPLPRLAQECWETLAAREPDADRLAAVRGRIDRVLAAHPHDPAWLSLEGAALYRAGRLEAAHGRLEQAWRRFGDVLGFVRADDNGRSTLPAGDPVARASIEDLWVHGNIAAQVAIARETSAAAAEASRERLLAAIPEGERAEVAQALRRLRMESRR